VILLHILVQAVLEALTGGGVQRSVIVTPDQGYGEQGYEEVPGGATVELLIELLDYKTA
jgi:FKBP-type peptidyl-prolyl cis-trans isomerase